MRTRRVFAAILTFIVPLPASADENATAPTTRRGSVRALQFALKDGLKWADADEMHLTMINSTEASDYFLKAAPL